MLDAGQLSESPHKHDLSLRPVPSSDGGLIGDLYRRIWEPIGGGGRQDCTDQQWVDELSRTGMQAWVANFDTQDVGMAELAWSGTGDAAFVVIGVVPESQGLGLGGDLLSRLTRHLWQTTAPNGHPTTRVWIWTRPDEHRHTIPNYLARGFRYAEPRP